MFMRAYVFSMAFLTCAPRMIGRCGVRYWKYTSTRWFAAWRGGSVASDVIVIGPVRDWMAVGGDCGRVSSLIDAMTILARVIPLLCPRKRGCLDGSMIVLLTL